MLSTTNLLKPADGGPIVGPQKDMVLGVYYLTFMHPLERKGHGRLFSDLDDVELAYGLGQVDIHARIKVMITTWYNEKNERYERPQRRLVETTVGRALFNRILPDEMRLYNDSCGFTTIRSTRAVCRSLSDAATR